MVTVMGSKGRKYEVRSALYGKVSFVHRLFYGGVLLASTQEKGTHLESDISMEATIQRANIVADALGIEISD